MSDEKNQNAAKEFEERKDLPFKKLSIYNHLLPIVVDILNIIEGSEKDRHIKLWYALYETSVNAVTELIAGYNKYHSDHKAEIYNKVRSSISRMQAIIIILTHLKQFNKESEQKYCAQLEECIRATSSLIRKMEGNK